jgi:hypothetical protein
MGAHSFNQVIGYRNLEELAERIKTFSFRVTKENVLKDVPPKIYTTRQVKFIHRTNATLSVDEETRIDSGQ